MSKERKSVSEEKRIVREAYKEMLEEEEKIETLRQRIVRALKKEGLEVNTERMQDNGLIIDIMDDEYFIRFVEETIGADVDED